MKAFQFPLERALTWRQTQLNMAEAALRRSNADLQRVAQEIEECSVRRVNSQAALLCPSPPGATPRIALMSRPHIQVTGTDLCDLEQAGIWAARRERELLREAEELQVVIVKQTRTMVEARRRVRLLENLKQRRREDWTAEENRELEELAGESAVTTWRRLHNPARA